MRYLIESIQNEYKFSDEDRLSQTLSASFNSSEKFRKLFLRFIGFASLRQLHSLTQQNYKAGNKDARIDVCLVDARGTPVVVIESKIDSPLLSEQLKKYNQVKELAHVKRKIALVKHCFVQPPEKLGWEVRYWSDLHGLCFDSLEKLKNKQIDKFIIQNFVDYLEELEMSNVRLIKGEDLEELAKAIHALRNEDAPHCHLKKPVFQLANDFLKMTEQIVKQARQERIITNRLKRNFRFSPWIGCADYEEKKRWNAWIGVELGLQKPYQKIYSIGTGIYFDIKKGKQYEICTEAYDEHRYEHQSEKYKDKDLVFEKYANQVIASWKNWLR